MTDIVERLKSGEALESKTPRLKTYPLMLTAAEEIDRLRARLEWSPEHPEIDGIYCRDETIRLQDAEIERLRAKLQDTAQQNIILDAANTALRAEVEALRRDAERFRWLLNGRGYFMEEQMLCGPHDCSAAEQDEARAIIDAAISEQALQALADEAQAMGLYDLPGDEKR